MSEHYPLAASSWADEEINAIKNLLLQDQFTMGENVKKFETEFSEYFNSKYSVMVNSGSSANLLAIAALFYTKDNPLKRGDEVIVPAVSWGTTYFPLQQFGLRVKFVDIDSDTLNINIETLKSAISKKTKLIVAVNLLGNPNKFDTLTKLCQDNNITLFEDNCESMGAQFDKKYTGTFGRLGTFSTYFSHHISTIEGGLIVTDNEELYHIMLSMRSHGWTRALPKINKVVSKGDREFEESFKFVLPGYNIRPTEISAVLGSEQLKKLPKFIEIRKNNAKYFRSLFINHPYIKTQKEIGESSWFGFSLILTNELSDLRNELTDFLEQNNIECRSIVAGNFVNHDVIKYFNYEIHDELKVANMIDTSGLYVGNHHFCLKNEINYLYKKIKEFVEQQITIAPCPENLT
jgi:CDP-4-dehydro-6-deoxyglucose reductase, E1